MSRPAAKGRAAPSLDLGILNPNRYPDARGLADWTAAMLAVVAPAAESFAVRFCGDREMRRVNRTYRNQDTTTDVLSFPGDAGDEGHLGDVLISVPAARRQAAEHGHPVAREIKVLLLHGALHCLGYDHETDDGEMERIERGLRRRVLREGFGG